MSEQYEKITPNSTIGALATAAKTFIECAGEQPLPDDILMRAAVAFGMLVRAQGVLRVQPEGPGRYDDLDVPHAVAMIASNFADDPPSTPQRAALFAAKLPTCSARAFNVLPPGYAGWAMPCMQDPAAIWVWLAPEEMVGLTAEEAAHKAEFELQVGRIFDAQHRACKAAWIDYKARRAAAEHLRSSA